VGLDIYLSGPGIEEDAKSLLHPEHYSNRSYLRSSYNESGFNSVAGALLDGRDLYWVFGDAIESGGGESQPTKRQLQAALRRAKNLRDDLAKAENLGVSFFSPNPWKDANRKPDSPAEPVSDESALAIFREQAKGYAERVDKGDTFIGGSYSNYHGSFFLDEPMKVRALIEGKGFGGKGFYAVYDSDLTFYNELADIVVEFIEYALTSESPTIIWSS